MNQQLTLEAILEEIRQKPNERLAHLAYADLAEEIGGDKNIARARAIRSLMVEWQELSEVNEATMNLASFYANPDKRLEFTASFRGGFLRRVKCKEETWLARGKELYAAEPIEYVSLTDWHLTDGGDGRLFIYTICGWDETKKSPIKALMETLFFSSSDLARRFISEACLKYARGEK